MTPQTRMLRFTEAPQDAVAEIERQGGLAWVTPDYGRNMSGREEFMGYKLNYFSPEQVRKTAALDREQLEAYLSRWMDAYGRPMHTTTLECVVDGVVEYIDGEQRSQPEWIGSDA